MPTTFNVWVVVGHGLFRWPEIPARAGVCCTVPLEPLRFVKARRAPWCLS